MTLDQDKTNIQTILGLTVKTGSVSLRSIPVCGLGFRVVGVSHIDFLFFWGGHPHQIGEVRLKTLWYYTRSGLCTYQKQTYLVCVVYYYRVLLQGSLFPCPRTTRAQTKSLSGMFFKSL